MTTGAWVVLEGGSARALVSLAHGGRLASLCIYGLELLVPEDQGPGPLDWGCYPMAPFAGRVRHGRFRFDGRTYELPRNLPPHAIHGTTFDTPWVDEGKGRLWAPLGPKWPFQGRAVQRLGLSRDTLHLRLEVHADDRAMPASCGWHPWWQRRLRRGRALDLAFEALTMLERDGEGVATGGEVAPSAGPWDDCFTHLLSPPRLQWPGALSLTIETSCEYLVVFDDPDHALCVEPQTAPPDALNLGPAIVEPGRPLVAEVVLRWEPA